MMEMRKIDIATIEAAQPGLTRTQRSHRATVGPGCPACFRAASFAWPKAKKIRPYLVRGRNGGTSAGACGTEGRFACPGYAALQLPASSRKRRVLVANFRAHNPPTLPARSRGTICHNADRPTSTYTRRDAGVLAAEDRGHQVELGRATRPS